MQIIPVPSGVAFFRQRVQLEGVDFYLDFAWNGRAGTWALGLLDGDENVLVTGMTGVSNRPLLRRYRHKLGMPAGEIVFLDPTGTIDAANFEQLGKEVSLVYVLSTELVNG